MKLPYIPLKECSIFDIYNGEDATYSIPIYQRNYAWGNEEISTLIQDVYDAYSKTITESQMKTKCYYIGTLVSYYQGDNVYEIIDGQQRLTTIYIVLKALGIQIRNNLSFKSRKKSSKTINSIPHFDTEEQDSGIYNGYFYALNSIKELIPKNMIEKFKDFFSNQVHIIHYQVPKDIDLNHYFEIMNSRGEQLEKHEIVKAKLIAHLKSEEDKQRFHAVWENCCEMGVYIQQRYRKSMIFGTDLSSCEIFEFEDLPVSSSTINHRSIIELIEGNNTDNSLKDEHVLLDTFQPIIDFPNFLLHVLKIIKCQTDNINIDEFNLDDKELIKEFDNIAIDEEFVKYFALTLLRCKFFLDNYLVHHTNEEDSIDHNPWKLEYYQRGKRDYYADNEYLKNLGGEESKEIHHKLVHLLSMFEVTYTARQRKNYLFYCLLFLNSQNEFDINNYFEFVRGLANQFLHKIYLVKDNLNEINTPKPGSFDIAILKKTKKGWNINDDNFRSLESFNTIYGNGKVASLGIPLFIFNLLDYKIWEMYADQLKGNKLGEKSSDRKRFFDLLGCSDFDLKYFRQFYFSRTRRSLEHYFPQANVSIFNNSINENEINCFGNYAMIGNEANSIGSNWSPIEKRNRYLDTSGKVHHISIASLKFFIMMQVVQDNKNTNISGLEWSFKEIELHQKKMVDILL